MRELRMAQRLEAMKSRYERTREWSAFVLMHGELHNMHNAKYVDQGGKATTWCHTRTHVESQPKNSPCSSGRMNPLQEPWLRCGSGRCTCNH